MKDEHLRQISKTKRMQPYIFILAILAITVWAAAETDVSINKLFVGTYESLVFIFVDLLPPDLSSLPRFIEPALETIYMSFVAMIIGTLISAFLAVFAAATTSPHPIVQVIMRGISSLFRNIPVLIWILLLSASYGLGALVGTLALTMVSVGMLTRAFSEVLEEIDMNQLEAVRATGANYYQILAQGVLPQFLPGFFGWSLYMLEMNVRASTIIGMVGGGGLGFVIQSDIKLFQYEQVSMAILLVLLIVLATEWVTSQIRERII